jgi:hypothetical protein
MKNFSYIIEHDFGLAPNPFGGYCTLAVCKPIIRSNKGLEVGSWVIGNGSKKLKNVNKLIYAMQVEEKITFNEYWNDPRFQYKKPVINGTLVQMYGDNIYHQNEEGKWLQENSAHSLANGVPNTKHLKNDINGQFVLISTNFYYFGDQAISVPEEFVRDVFCNSRGMRSPSISKEAIDKFISWLSDNYTPGILYGDPTSWVSYLKK